MEPESNITATPSSRRRIWRITALILLLAAACAAVPALNWQRLQSQKTRCISNERRLATSLLLYAQDHDGRLPPVDYQTADGRWRHWVDLSQAYIARQEITECPANPADGAKEPAKGYPFPYSYALNTRFFGVFGPGPFPIENLELPASTALLVEGGPFFRSQHAPTAGTRHALSGYWDHAADSEAYATPHDGRMNVAAADGHVITLKIPSSRAGGHDPLYGRLAGTIYNWNGGHPNGDTGGPPKE